MGEPNKRYHHLKKSKSNGIVEHRVAKIPQDPEFKHRESPLTYLIKTSLHLRVVYHIFVVIFLILLFDTVIYDFMEHGKIYIGIRTVKVGFGDIGRGIKLWLFELAMALSFYPGLLLYVAGASLFKNNTGIRSIWKSLAIAGLVALQATLISGPVRNMNQKHLAFASAAAVSCEMLRFAMKIHAVTVACASRWRDGSTPLPTFRHYLYFLFAPTLIYRDQYPRTKKTRWGVVIISFMEVAAFIFYSSFLWERFVLPYWSDYGKQSKVAASTVFRGMFACVLPGITAWLCGFYCILHSCQNAFAEMLKFGDRLFYEEWWTTSQYATYYRTWNRVVHSWLRDHIYTPLIPVTGRAGAAFIVFIVSACVHEVVLTISFGFFYPVLLVEFGVISVSLIPVTAACARRFPNIMNLLLWLGFFIGNGILWSLYPMENFARKNCPPSDNDSFFIPKSWTCPEIVF